MKKVKLPLNIQPLLVFFLLFIVNNSMADIREIDELVRNSRKIVWTNLENDPIVFGESDAVLGIVKSGTKPSEIQLSNDRLYYDESLLKRTLEIVPCPTLGRKNTGIRGSYIVTLPNWKRIQLEISYDLASDSAQNHGKMDFYIEVEEKNGLNPNQWVLTSTFDKDGDRAKIDQIPIKSYKSSFFSSYDFVVNLSPWRGKEIKINLVSEVPSSVVTPQMGRWVQIRLVALTFDYIWDRTKSISNDQTIEFKAKTNDRRSNIKPMVTPTPIPGPAGEILLYNKEPNLQAYYDLVHCPDAGINCVVFNNQVHAYFSAARYSPVEQGTFALRFSGSGNMGSTISTVQNSLYKAYDPYSRLIPWRLFAPLAQPTQSFDHYLGVSGSIVGSVNGTSTVHAFWQAEDQYNSSGQKYSSLYAYGAAYGRIGYSRSTDGINFTRMHDSSGSLVQNATPVITHWQTEEIAYGPKISPFTQDPGGMQGTGPCSIIENGSYYYLFYTRFIDIRDQNADPGFAYYPGYGFPPFLSVYRLPMSNPTMDDFNIYFASSTCVARALISDVNSPNYGTNPNPWKKYRKERDKNAQGQWLDTWTESWVKPGGCGWDTAILKTPGTYGKVSWNTYLGTYLMVSQGAVAGRFYLHQSNGSNLMDWQDGVLLDGIYETGKGYAYPSLIGLSGNNDRSTGTYNWLYYARDDNPHGGGYVDGGHYMVRRSLDFEK